MPTPGKLTVPQVYNDTIRGSRPSFSTDRELKIIDGRHPLLDERLDLRGDGGLLLRQVVRGLVVADEVVVRLVAARGRQRRGVEGLRHGVLQRGAGLEPGGAAGQPSCTTALAAVSVNAVAVFPALPESIDALFDAFVASFPAFFVLRVVNALYMLSAVWREVVMRRPLLVYEKGH